MGYACGVPCALSKRAMGCAINLTPCCLLTLQASGDSERISAQGNRARSHGRMSSMCPEPALNLVRRHVPCTCPVLARVEPGRAAGLIRRPTLQLQPTPASWVTTTTVTTTVTTTLLACGRVLCGTVWNILWWNRQMRPSFLILAGASLGCLQRQSGRPTAHVQAPARHSHLKVEERRRTSCGPRSRTKPSKRKPL